MYFALYYFKFLTIELNITHNDFDDTTANSKHDAPGYFSILINENGKVK